MVFTPAHAVPQPRAQRSRSSYGRPASHSPSVSNGTTPPQPPPQEFRAPRLVPVVVVAGDGRFTVPRIGFERVSIRGGSGELPGFGKRVRADRHCGAGRGRRTARHARAFVRVFFVRALPGAGVMEEAAAEVADRRLLHRDPPAGFDTFAERLDRRSGRRAGSTGDGGRGGDLHASPDRSAAEAERRPAAARATPRRGPRERMYSLRIKPTVLRCH